MTSISEVLQKVLLLTANVESLRNDIRRIDALLLDLSARVVRMESSGDLIEEKAKNAALSATQAMNAETLKEIYNLRSRIEEQTRALSLGGGD